MHLGTLAADVPDAARTAAEGNVCLVLMFKTYIPLSPPIAVAQVDSHILVMPQGNPLSNHATQFSHSESLIYSGWDQPFSLSV